MSNKSSKKSKITSKEIEKAIINNPQILEKVIENPEIASIIVSREEISMHSGPIPSPEILKGYFSIDESLPNRIMLMAENQSNHRMQLEKEVIKANIKNEIWGMILGAIISIVSIVGGIYLVANDKNAVGLAAIFAPIASILGIFINNKKKEKEEIKKNNEDLI